MSDFVSDTNKTIEDARNKAMNSIKEYAQPKVISSFFEMAISIAMIVGIQFIAFGLDLTMFYKWSFWVRTIFMSIAIFMLFRSVVNARYPKTESRDVVIETKTKYKDKLESIKDLNMKIWLNKVFNVEMKVDAYISKMNRKINRLENKLSKCYKENKIKKLEEKLSKLSYLVSEDYVKTHISSIHVKYFITYYNDFTNITLFGHAGEFNTRVSYSKEFNLKSLKKMWVYVLSTAILGMSMVGLEEYSVANVITSLLSSAFMITTRIVSAILEADQIYDKTILASLECKIEVLDAYKMYKDNHPAQTEIQTIEEQVRNEIKQELKIEYDKEYEEKLSSEVAKIRSELNSTFVNAEKVA